MNVYPQQISSIMEIEAYNCRTITKPNEVEFTSPICLKQRISKKIRDWSAKTTSHGLPRIVESHQLHLKLMWFIFLLISVFLCIFMCTKSIIEYLQYDVTTRIRMVSSNQITFPQIAICNMNPLITKTARDFIQDYKENFDRFNLSKYVSLSENEEKIVYKKNDFEWLFYITSHPKFAIEKRKKFGYSAKDTFRNPTFQNKPCNISDFISFYHPNYGNCYKFNSERVARRVSRDGDGFITKIFAGSPDTTVKYLYEHFTKGIILLIDDHENFPLRSEGIVIKPGTYAKIKLTKTIAVTMPEPYSNCKDSSQVDTILAKEMEKLKLAYNRFILNKFNFKLTKLHLKLSMVIYKIWFYLFYKGEIV